MHSRSIPLRPLLLAAGLAFVLAAAGCGDGPAPLFPEDYAETYTEVRDCRQSGDHDLHMIRVLADDVALDTYADRSAPFPAGATVIKEEYDFGDFDCTGPIVQWTVMQKLDEGESPERLDWEWQTVDADRFVTEDDPQRCANCHQGCGVPPDGFDGTCTVP